MDIAVFVSRGGKGGNRVNAAIAEARPVCKGDGSHFTERGNVVVKVASESRDRQ